MAAKSEAGIIRGPLSHPERRVLRLAAQGRTDEEIARRVFLGDRSVRTHLTTACAKLARDWEAIR